MLDVTFPSQLGPYRILERLGAGGMGTVYRARDDRLTRDVALKVLLDGPSGRAGDQARLLWEARAASALNHPSIVAVFDVGTDGGVSYIVSELVNGEPLRRELDRGPIETRRLLSIATQIAEGMAAAHAAGITHGDLKPENVLVGRDGRAKIVDFGLATGTGPPSTPPSTPVPAFDTHPGLIVGTVAYASPEQAQGRSVDARSDQFSFGVMLFEMATGTHPFRRPSPVETLSAIIHDDTPDAATLNARVPQSFQWALDRCLAKTPEDRYVSTSDLVLDLRAVHDRLLKQPAGSSRRRSPFRRDLAMAAAGVVIGVLGLTAWLFGTAGPLEETLSHASYTPLAADPGFQGQPAWSADGLTIAYAAEVDGVLQIFTRRVTASQDRLQVTSCRVDCDNPFWSPDGNYIYYHSQRADKVALYRTTPVNGTPELVLENATRAALSPDGKTLAFVKDESDQVGAMSLWLASAISAPIPAASTSRYVEPPLGRTLFSSLIPRFSPDGKHLLLRYKSWMEMPPLRSGFMDISLPDRRARLVLQPLLGNLTMQAFSWMPDSRHIVTMMGIPGATAVHLWMADTATDTAWPITNTGGGSEGFPTVSRDGRIAYAQEETNFDLVRVPLDGSGLPTLLSTSRDEFDPAWSPRAREPEYAYVTNRSGPLEIRLRTVDGRWDKPLVTEEDFPSTTVAIGSLAFSPDGESLAYQRLGAAEGDRLYVSKRGSSVRPLRVANNDSYQDAPSWSPNGKFVTFVQGSPRGWDLVTAQPGVNDVKVIASDVVPYSRPQWSPDGAFIAFLSEAGLALIRPDGTDVKTVSNDDWLTFAWNPVDVKLYGLRRDDDRVHFSLAVLNPATGEVRAIGHDLGLIPIANQPIRGFTWTGHDFATSIARVKSDIWLLDGVGNPPSFFDRFWFFSGFFKRSLSTH